MKLSFAQVSFLPCPSFANSSDLSIASRSTFRFPFLFLQPACVSFALDQHVGILLERGAEHLFD